MANLNISVDYINQFIISNFIPYAWSHMWETTIPNKNGSYSFIMTIRPNVIERNEFDHTSGLIHKLMSSNSGNFIPVEYHSCYVIRIPLIKGNSICRGDRELNSDPKMKAKYTGYLENYILDAIDKMYGIAEPKLEGKSIFGTHYSKVKWWMNYQPRKTWTFIQRIPPQFNT
tara:strand:- start:3703 stop:4218 length:516 start_codon:yes stop_codon:yes gene_type:complete